MSAFSSQSFSTSAFSVNAFAFDDQPAPVDPGGSAARARKKRERDQQFIEIMKQVIISAIHKRLG